MQQPSPSPVVYVRVDSTQRVTHLTVPDPLGARLLTNLEQLRAAVTDGDIDSLVPAAVGLTELLDEHIHILPPVREAA
ncbi:MAG TPA: hypothetical protein VF168_14555 [Trueperaceae bacterium]